MLKKLHNQHQHNEHYLKPRSDEVHAFGIAHFAGDVYYRAEGVLEKNRDTFSNDLFDLLHQSKSKHLLELFAGERAMVRRWERRGRGDGRGGGAEMGREEGRRWEGRRGGLSGGMERVKTSDNWERIARAREEERKGDEQGNKKIEPPTQATHTPWVGG